MGRSAEYAVAAGLTIGTLLGRDTKPAVAGGGCVPGLTPEDCYPIMVKQVETPRFMIRAYRENERSSVIDLAYFSRTHFMNILWPTTSGEDEALESIEKYCGPNGDHSLMVFYGDDYRELALKRADCLAAIPNSSITTIR
jgi:hypothetical protein